MAKIYIYNVNVDPSKNVVIENLETWLGNLTPVYSDTDFQFIKPQLETTIKLYIKTDYDLALVKNGNFIKVVEKPNSNSAEVTYYYFITAAKWIADYTVEFTIALDTLNTWWDDITTNINNRTHITRQHKDRFEYREQTTKTIDVAGTSSLHAGGGGLYSGSYTIYNDDYVGLTVDSFDIETNNVNAGVSNVSISDGWLTISFSGNAAITFSFIGTVDIVLPAGYVRKIDRFSEGITPVLFGNEIDNVYDESTTNWYLVYSGNPMICQLFPNEPITVSVAAKNTVVPTDLTTGVYYYAMEDRTAGDYRTSYTIKTDNSQYYFVRFWPAVPEQRDCVCFYRDGSDIKIRRIIYIKHSNGWQFHSESEWGTCSSIEITGDSNLIAHTLTSYQHNLTPIYNGSLYTFIIVPGSYTLNTIDSVDRTGDNTLYKIIKLPYAPIDITEVSPIWAYNNSTGGLQLRNLDASLGGKIKSDSNPLANKFVSISPSIIQSHSINNESKLYHSDYYQPKFVYDSFSKKFDLERLNLSNSFLNENTPFSATFNVTNTMNSRFLFTFNQYTTDGNQLEDYDNILIANRNNELPIYTSDYMNYLKTGYNYDIKAKEIQVGTTVGTTLVATAGSAALLALGASGGNPIAAAVGAGVGLAGGIISVISQTQNSANSIAQKEAQYKNQAGSVRGADDVDLLTIYSNNKAKLIEYKPTDQMKNALYNLFRLTGYACDEYGIPNFNSRYWYNFVQCEPQFVQNNNAVYNDFLDDIKNRFKLGVTIFHGNGIYDINQNYENWETSLL